MKATIQGALRRYLAWLSKEWRDQRAVTLGIALAIPGLTALGYWAFGERIGHAHLDNVRVTFLAIAIGLVVFAIAGDLLAGENRRKTIHTVRRLPGGMGSAFAAKVTLLVVILLGAIALQGISLAIAEHLNAPRMAKLGISDYHRNGAVRSTQLFMELGDFGTSRLWVCGFGLGVFGLWTLLVSSWMGRSGVASIGAVVLLAACVAPFVMFFKEHPWFFPGPMRLATSAAGLMALVGLLGAGLSFLRGQRFAGRPLRPVLWGMAVVLVAVSGTYAYAQVSVRQWIQFGPDAEGFRIQGAQMGAGGRFLYLNVTRGAMWDGTAGGNHGHMHRDPWASQRGTPVQAWVVDLEKGTHAPIDGRAVRYFLDVPETQGVPALQTLDPVEALSCYHLEDPETPSIRFWDARQGSAGRVLHFNLRDAHAAKLARAQLAADSWVLDESGRRAWLNRDVVERAGEAYPLPEGLVSLQHGERRIALSRPIPGGWYGYAPGKAGMRACVIDATSGERLLLPERKGRSYGWHAHMLSTSRMLVHEHYRDENDVRQTRLRVQAFADPGTLLAPKNEPPVIDRVIGRDRVLALRGPEGDRTLHVWDPLTGHDLPLAWKGEALEDIQRAGIAGRTGDGRSLITLWSGRGRDVRSAQVVLDAEQKTLTTVVPWGRRSIGAFVALMPDNTLVVLRSVVHGVRNQVVRIEPGGRERVLFPAR